MIRFINFFCVIVGTTGLFVSLYMLGGWWAVAFVFFVLMAGWGALGVDF